MLLTEKFLLCCKRTVASPLLNWLTGSASACPRAIAAYAHLERSGAITGYRARLDAVALGLTFEALVFATMRDSNRDTFAAFESAVSGIPNIQQAQRLFGDPDYLLRVVARDLAAFQTLYDEQLATLPGVQRLTSTLVMKSIIDGRPLPL